MKKQYILAALLLIGFGVIYTQAFQLTALDAAAPDAYTVSADSTTATVDSVKIRPSKGGDRMVIKLEITGDDEGEYVIGIELEDGTGFYVATGATIAPSTNANSDLANGYLEFDHTLDGTTELVTITIDKANIWQDVDGFMITLADATA